MDQGEAAVKAALEAALGAVSKALLDKQNLYRIPKGEDREVLDTKSVKELISVLREICDMLRELDGQQEGREQPGLRVIFEAGEESWNE